MLTSTFVAYGMNYSGEPEEFRVFIEEENAKAFVSKMNNKRFRQDLFWEYKEVEVDDGGEWVKFDEN